MNKNMKKLGVFIFLLIVALAAILLSGCIQKLEEKASEPIIPPPPTTPVSQGYIQSYNHELNYGYEYPETWMMHGSDYFHMDGGILNAEMFVDEPEGTSITVIAKTSIWKDLDEAKSVIRDAYREDILNERIIEVNGIKGYELTHQSTNYPVKSKIVVFYVDGRIYEFDYGADETLYEASESIWVFRSIRPPSPEHSSHLFQIKSAT